MADFWKERCLQAEALLAKARGGLVMSAPREAVLQQLGDLKAGQWAPTHALRGKPGDATWAVDARSLRLMEECGLVESRPSQADGRVLEWRLAPLVVPGRCGVLEGGLA